MLGAAVRRSGKKFKAVIGLLAATLVAVSAFGFWKIHDLRQEKSAIDEQIQRIETALSQGGQNADELEELVGRLEQYQARASELQKSFLYQLGAEAREQAFIESEIQTLMTDFGSEIYSIPPEFVEQVDRFIRQFQERDRRHVERVLGRSKGDLEIIRTVFREQNLPEDLAYIVLVESAFLSHSISPAGAAGPWQFTDSTTSVSISASRRGRPADICES